MFVVDSKGICKKVPDHVGPLLEPHFLRWAPSAGSKDATISSLHGSPPGVDSPAAGPSFTFTKPDFGGRSRKKPNWFRYMLFSVVILLGLSGAAGVIYLIATRNREERLPGSEPHHYPVHIHVPVHAGSGSAMEQPPIYVPRPPVRPGPAMEHHPINVPRPPVRPAFRWWTFRVR
jgi:hypothetical protein